MDVRKGRRLVGYLSTLFHLDSQVPDLTPKEFPSRLVGVKYTCTFCRSRPKIVQESRGFCFERGTQRGRSDNSQTSSGPSSLSGQLLRQQNSVVKGFSPRELEKERRVNHARFSGHASHSRHVESVAREMASRGI